MDGPLTILKSESSLTNLLYCRPERISLVSRFYSYCRQPLPLCRETFTWQKSVTAPPVNHPLPTLCDCRSFKLDFQNEYLVCVDVDNKPQSFKLCTCLCALLFGSTAFITFRRRWCTVWTQHGWGCLQCNCVRVQSKSSKQLPCKSLQQWGRGTAVRVLQWGYCRSRSLAVWTLWSGQTSIMKDWRGD